MNFLKFEEREYKCLGQWMENGFIYTYTKRVDVGTYECFVGAQHIDNRIFIKEAGEHCQRNIDPNRFGMELQKTKFCDTNDTRYDGDLHQTNNLDNNMPNYSYNGNVLNSSNIVPNANTNGTNEHQHANELAEVQTNVHEDSLTAWRRRHNELPMKTTAMPNKTAHKTQITTKPEISINYDNQDNHIRSTSTSKSYIEYEVNAAWLTHAQSILCVFSTIIVVLWA